jgi:hypothetical protein
VLPVSPVVSAARSDSLCNMCIPDPPIGVEGKLSRGHDSWSEEIRVHLRSSAVSGSSLRSLRPGVRRVLCGMLSRNAFMRSMCLPVAERNKKGGIMKIILNIENKRSSGPCGRRRRDRLPKQPVISSNSASRASLGGVRNRPDKWPHSAAFGRKCPHPVQPVRTKGRWKSC